MNKKSIKFHALLPNGICLDDIGEIWASVNQQKHEGSVTIVSPSYLLPNGNPGDYRIHLTPDQVERISPSSGNSDFEYEGELKPCGMAEHGE